MDGAIQLGPKIGTAKVIQVLDGGVKELAFSESNFNGEIDND